LDGSEPQTTGPMPSSSETSTTARAGPVREDHAGGAVGSSRPRPDIFLGADGTRAPGRRTRPDRVVGGRQGVGEARADGVDVVGPRARRSPAGPRPGRRCWGCARWRYRWRRPRGSIEEASKPLVARAFSAARKARSVTVSSSAMCRVRMPDPACGSTRRSVSTSLARSSFGEDLRRLGSGRARRYGKPVIVLHSSRLPVSRPGACQGQYPGGESCRARTTALAGN